MMAHIPERLPATVAIFSRRQTSAVRADTEGKMSELQILHALKSGNCLIILNVLLGK